MTDSRDPDDLEARLLRSEAELDASVWQALAPGDECLSLSDVMDLSAATRTPSRGDLDHLEECRRCRVSLIAGIRGASVTRQAALGEAFWTEHRARMSDWRSFVAQTRRELGGEAGPHSTTSVVEREEQRVRADSVAGPRAPSRRPWWRRKSAWAAACVLALVSTFFLLRVRTDESYGERPIANWTLADAQGNPIVPSRGGDPGHAGTSLEPTARFRIQFRIFAPTYVRLLAYDRAGRRVMLEPPERAAVPIAPGKREFGPSDALGPGPCDVLTVTSIRSIPDRAIDELLPLRLRDATREAREGEIAHLVETLRARLGCSVDRHAVNSDRP